MFFVAIYFVPLLFLFVSALPLKKEQQTLLQQTSAILEDDPITLIPSTIPSTTAISYTLSNDLTNYYENIVDQVMESTIDDVITSAPHSYNLLYPGHDCQATTCPFIDALHGHLNLMRSNLVASVRPLLDSNLQTLPFKITTSNNGDLINTAHAINNHLTETLIVLNQRISIQLGLIVNADDTADVIIRQSVPWNYSEHWGYRSRRRQLSSKTFSRRAHEKLSWNSEATNNYDDKANKALAEWLRLWLSDIENTLYTQFDECIEDVGRTVMDSFW